MKISSDHLSKTNSHQPDTCWNFSVKLSADLYSIEEGETIIYMSRLLNC